MLDFRGPLIVLGIALALGAFTVLVVLGAA